MSWFSILPANLTIVETWLIRFFLLLGLLTIGPWVLFLIYDIVLYILRALYYEIPYIGGRAQGKRKPQAPTLAERPNGRRRTFSINTASGVDGYGDAEWSLKQRFLDPESLDEDEDEEDYAFSEKD